MAPAARQLDATSHPGLISTGSPNVFIDSLPAARQLDLHACAFPPPAGPHPTNPITSGSRSVLINGRQAARLGDKTGCGGLITMGSTTIFIGG